MPLHVMPTLKKIVLVSLTAGVLLCGKTNAQEKFSDNLHFMASAQTGYLLPEYHFFTLITNDYIRSAEFCILKESPGKTIFQQKWNYPEYGISLFWSTLGNDEVFGRELALTYFFKVYFSSGNKLRFYNRMGIGPGYVTKKFDLQDNYLNVAVGSNLNLHYNFRLGFNYPLGQRFRLDAGIALDHFSNANTSDPNVGLNYFTFYTAFSYRAGKPFRYDPISDDNWKAQNSMAVFAAFGGKHTRYLSSKYYPAGSLSFEFNRDMRRSFRLGAGFDFFYDSSAESQIESDGGEFRKSYSYRTGFHLSQTLVYNRFSLTIQEGWYVFLPDHILHKKIYNRGIIQFRVTDRISVRLAMKSHLFVLDYPEFGIGIKI